MEYTVIEQKANRERLVRTLRAGTHKQGKGRLRRAFTYCVGGVACDISGLGHWEFTHGIYVYLKYGGSFPPEVQKFYGFQDSSGSYWTGDKYNSLMGLNDDGVTFEELADLIESEPNGMFS